MLMQHGWPQSYDVCLTLITASAIRLTGSKAARAQACASFPDLATATFKLRAGDYPLTNEADWKMLMTLAEVTYPKNQERVILIQICK